MKRDQTNQEKSKWVNAFNFKYSLLSFILSHARLYVFIVLQCT